MIVRQPFDLATVDVSTLCATAAGPVEETLETLCSASAPLSPVNWVAAARHRADLAAAIVDSVVQTESQAARRSPDLAIRRFIRLPRWGALAARLDEPPLSRLGRRSVAALARSLSVHFGWGQPEAAYWLGLVSPCSGRPEGHPDPKDDPAAACVSIATELVDQPSLGLLAELRSAYPSSSWDAIRAELGEEAVEENHLSPADRLDLARLARLSHLALQNERLEVFSVALAAPTPERFITGLADWLRAMVNAPAAIWVDRMGTKGNGCGAVIGSAKPLAYIDDMERLSFEDSLPGILRSSHPVTSRDGTELARVYFQEPSSLADLTPWLERLAGALASRAIAPRPRVPHVRHRHAELERELRAAIAEFAAGAGHEINNPLGAILGQVRALSANELEPSRRRALERITELVDRVFRMIRDLHVIGRQTRPRVQMVNLGSLLAEAVATPARRRVPADVTLEPVDGDLSVRGNAADLTRLVAELVQNAAHAAGPTGHVSVSATKQGRWIEINVRDSGPGFTQEARRFAAVPYFSGRAAGRGLGMGLPVAFQIAGEHGGSIAIHSGRPTIVSVRLPLAEAAEPIPDA